MTVIVVGLRVAIVSAFLKGYRVLATCKSCQRYQSSRIATTQEPPTIPTAATGYNLNEREAPSGQRTGYSLHGTERGTAPHLRQEHMLSSIYGSPCR
jgi:hypothetical protein